MTPSCEIESVGERIRYTVSELAESGALSNDPVSLYEEHEQLAVQILDSEHMDWPEVILEHYLQVFLYCIQKELGLSHTI